MNSLTIVVVTYNRANSLKRLLNSLNNVNYLNDKINLYISVDKDSKNIEKHKEVLSVAEEFEWKYGDKILNIEEKNLGLKEHIIKCGNLTNIYENVIVLEDDIIVSPMMYIYAKQVLEFYKDDKRIAGFGLYSFQRNPSTNLPFFPINNGTDIYFMQYACSWGQLWTKDRWNDFYKWYQKNKNTEFKNYNIPSSVRNWGEKSWLKYHIIYLILTNKLFVYPQIGLTSNFTDTGIHNNKSSFAYQCCMQFSNEEIKYRFVDIDKANNIYDAYFENINLDNNIECDIYGTKELEKIKNKKYVLTTNNYDLKIVKNYALQMYPYELNIINNIIGNDIKLYDLQQKEKNKIKTKKSILLRYIFKLDYLDNKKLIQITVDFIKEILNRILNKIRRK